MNIAIQSRTCKHEIIEDKYVLFTFDNGDTIKQQYNKKKNHLFYFMCRTGLLCNNTECGGDCWGEYCAPSSGYGAFCEDHKHQICFYCQMVKCECCRANVSGSCPRCERTGWISEEDISETHIIRTDKQYTMINGKIITRVVLDFKDAMLCEKCQAGLYVQNCNLCDMRLCNNCVSDDDLCYCYTYKS